MATRRMEYETIRIEFSDIFFPVLGLPQHTRFDRDKVREAAAGDVPGDVATAGPALTERTVPFASVQFLFNPLFNTLAQLKLACDGALALSAKLMSQRVAELEAQGWSLPSAPESAITMASASASDEYAVAYDQGGVWTFVADPTATNEHPEMHAALRRQARRQLLRLLGAALVCAAVISVLALAQVSPLLLVAGLLLSLAAIVGIGTRRTASLCVVSGRIRLQRPAGARAAAGSKAARTLTVSKMVLNAFTLLDDRSDQAVRDAKGYTVKKWRRYQATQAGTVAGAAAVVPGAHLVAGAAEMLFLLHKMAWVAWGIGGIYGCEVEGKDDLELILALWVHQLKEDDLRELFADCRTATLLRRELETNPKARAALARGDSKAFGTLAVPTVGLQVSLGALATQVAVNGATLPLVQLVAGLKYNLLTGATTLAQNMPHLVAVAASKGAASASLTLVSKVTGVPGLSHLSPMLGHYILGKNFLVPAAGAAVHQVGLAAQQHLGTFLLHLSHHVALLMTNKNVAKVLAGFVPLAGAGVAFTISAAILQGFAAKAETYYRLKRDAATL